MKGIKEKEKKINVTNNCFVETSKKIKRLKLKLTMFKLIKINSEDK